MADEMVLRAQRFINSYNVAGIPKVEEDGRTGWPVMRALTRALQHEIGITALSDSFGPGTLSRLQSVHPEVATATSQAAVVRILQSGLYCKGYDGGGIDGVFNSRTSDSCIRLKQNMGVASAYPGEGVTPKVFKALLNMDAYTLIGDGADSVRQVQQWLNGSYVSRRNYFIVPCDGFFSRDVQKALIYAIQYAIGMSDDVANGSLGPGTRDGIRRNEVGPGSAGTFVQLFAASMIVNKRDGVAFQRSFDANLSSRARAFQAFVMLPGTGRGDFQT